MEKINIRGMQFTNEDVLAVVTKLFENKGPIPMRWDEQLNLNIVIPDVAEQTKANLEILRSPKAGEVLNEIETCAKYAYKLLSTGTLTTEEFRIGVISLFKADEPYGQQLVALGVSPEWLHSVQVLIHAMFNECVYHPDLDDDPDAFKLYCAFRKEVIEADKPTTGTSALEWMYADIIKPLAAI